MKSMKSKRG